MGIRTAVGGEYEEEPKGGGVGGWSTNPSGIDAGGGSTGFRMTGPPYIGLGVFPSSSFEANLGCASTEELIIELVARVGTPLGTEVGYISARERTWTLGLLLGSLSPQDREYRTVDN